MEKDKNGVEIAISCEEADIDESRDADIFIVTGQSKCTIRLYVTNNSGHKMKLRSVDHFFMNNSWAVTLTNLPRDHVMQVEGMKLLYTLVQYFILMSINCIINNYMCVAESAAFSTPYAL